MDNNKWERIDKWVGYLLLGIPLWIVAAVILTLGVVVVSLIFSMIGWIRGAYDGVINR